MSEQPREMDRAVILARGLGTRIRKADATASLSAQQEAAAQVGLKAMIPVGRPFLDYSLSALADAGYRRVCLVIGPEHQAVRDYYTRQVRPRRISVEFAIQEKPLGTADAVAAAEDFAAGEPFLCLNSDNYYPMESLAALRTLGASGLAAFDRDALVELSNIPAQRIAQFAVVQTGPDGTLRGIVEKPSPQAIAALPQPICVSMNCWRFGPAIFDACRAIDPSPRGEYEIPSAVSYAVDHLGETFRVLTFRAPVLDLSSRQDIEEVAKRLQDVEVEL